MNNSTDPAPTPETPLPSSSAPAPKNHAWIWFFAFILVASVFVTAFMIWFNQSIQLTPEQLDKNWSLWKEKGPKDYVMMYTKHIHGDPKAMAYVVEVRGGKVIKVLQNGKPLEKTEDQQEDPRIFHSMDSLFRDADRFLEIDAKPGAPRVFVVGAFDDKTGALRRYIRRVMGSTQRVQIDTELKAVE